MIMSFFNSADSVAYKQFNMAYDKVTKACLELDSFADKEQICQAFLTEVGHYIVNKSNKEISPQIIAEAAVAARYYDYDISEERKNAYRDRIIAGYGSYSTEDNQSEKGHRQI